MVSWPLRGSPTQVTIGLRLSRTRQVWLHRMQGRIRSGVPARSLATRSASAICARVISTRSAAPASSAACAAAGSTTLPCRTTGTAPASAARIRGGQVLVEHRRGVRVRPVGADRVRAAADHRQQIQVRGQRGGLLRGLLRRDPGPRRQLVAAQPQGQDPARADRGAHRGQHLAGQRQPVRAVPVGALVGQPGVELAQQRAGPGVDLDPVQARRRQPRPRPRRTRRPARRSPAPPSPSAVSRLTASVNPDGPHSTRLRVRRRALQPGVARARPAPARRAGGRPRRSRASRRRSRRPAARARTASRTSCTDAVSVTISPAPPAARRW